MNDKSESGISDLRRRVAEASGGERVPALMDLAKALCTLALASDDEAVRRPYLDEATEALTKARELLAPGDERRAEVTLRLLATLTGRGDPLDDLDRVIELLREVTPGGVLETEKAEPARLVLGLILIKRLLDRHLKGGPFGFVALAAAVATRRFDDFEESVALLGQIEESLLPAEMRPLPPPVRLMLMSARMLLQGRAGALSIGDLRMVLDQARSLLNEVDDKGPLGHIAAGLRGLAAGVELRLRPDAAIAGKMKKELEPLKDLPAQKGQSFLLHELAFAYLIGDEGIPHEGLTKACETLAGALHNLDEDDPQREDLLVSLLGLQYARAALDPTPEAVREAQVTARRLNFPMGPPSDTRDAWKLAMLSSVLSVQGWFDDNDDALAEAWRRLREVLPFAACDAALASFILPILGLVLIRRAVGGLEDQRLGRDLMLKGMEIQALTEEAAGGTPPLVQGMRGLLSLFGEDEVDEAFRLERSATDLAAALEALPGSSAVRPVLVAGLAIARILRGIQMGDDTNVRTAVNLLEGFRASGQAFGPFGPYCTVLSALGRLYLGVLEQHSAMFDEALQSLEAAADVLQPPYGDREKLLRAIGWAHLLRAQFFNRGCGVLDKAIRALEEARALAASRPRWLQGTALPTYLADAYAEVGDLQRAVDAGMEALQVFAAEVLLQESPDHGLSAARGAAELARRFAGWCLEDGRPDLAVRALELGRGLVLYAATIAADVPDLLVGRGRPDLADEWRSVAGNPAGAAFTDLLASGSARPEATGREFVRVGAQALEDLLNGLSRRRVPSDLRHRVLLALTQSPDAGPLFEPPEAADIGDALDNASMDALVYLLHGDEAAPGRAVIVWADGRVEMLALPGLMLDTAPLNDYSPQNVGEKHSEHLKLLCDWAGDVAMRPLLGLFLQRTSKPEDAPRIVLVPCGALGVVPWHAARTATDLAGRPRHAVHDLVISYAATGRQFMDAAWLAPALDPDGVPTFVANPCPDGRELPHSILAVQAIAETFYPGSAVLGRPRTRTTGHGDLESVLNALPQSGSPGAPMLHLACHGANRLPPTRSVLSLYPAGAKGQLDVGRIIEQARRRPTGKRGGIVVLSACTSDLTVQDHDEALTLATAFLTAGIGCVIGSRWEVHEKSTNVMMFVFHHFLVHGGLAPVDALRSAQLWMLDPARSAPSTMPRNMAEMAATMSDASLAAISAWGAFTHQGL